MNPFAEELLRVRKELEDKSARAFFARLKSQGITFNYSYYMRLEQGGLPSEKVVKEIAEALGGQGDSLILSYCRALFPKNAYLFAEAPSAMGRKKPKSMGAPSVAASPVMGAQKELSPRQVAALAARSEAYHLFLLATLARRPLKREELARLFSLKSMEESLSALKEVELLKESEEGISALSVEAKFPEPYNKDLKLAFKQLDQWDESFGAEFQLESSINKMQIRRVSSRYLNLINKHIELIFDLVRSSDESDIRFNDQVVQFKVQLKRGNLPG
jgi:hypothetical protein